MTDGDHTKAIVFIHQSSGSPAVWKEVIRNEHLSKFRLYCLNIDGNGEHWDKNAIEQDYSLANLSNQIIDAINKLELERYMLVGVSIGTNIIGEIIDRLQKCSGIVLLGPSIVGGKITPTEILLPFEYGHVLVDATPEDGDLSHYLRGLTHYNNEGHQAMLKSDYLNTNPNYRIQLATTIGDGLWGDEIGNIRNSGRPVAIAYGVHDNICNTETLADVGFNLWQNKIHLIKDAGHLAHLDQPEEFSRLLADFAKAV